MRNAGSEPTYSLFTITYSLKGVGAGKRNITRRLLISRGGHGLHNPYPLIPGLMAAHCGKPFAGTSSKIISYE